MFQTFINGCSSSEIIKNRIINNDILLNKMEKAIFSVIHQNEYNEIYQIFRMIWIYDNHFINENSLAFCVHA